MQDVYVKLKLLGNVIRFYHCFFEEFGWPCLVKSKWLPIKKKKKL